MLDARKSLLVACFVWSFPAFALAQTTTQWDAMRVYFEQQYLEQVVTEAYSPITIKQLEEDLAAVQARRRDKPQVQRGVVKATYIAALLDDRLVSEQSVWQMRGAWQQLAADYADLGSISFSPMRARSQGDGQRQLVDIDRYLPTGELVVPDDPAYPEIVFGFTLTEVRRGSKQFDVRVPSASIAQMYVAVPSGMQVTSTLATAERVDASTVPLDVEANEYTALGKTSSEWWLLTCSGLPRFDIKIEKSVASGKGVPQILVSSGAIDYQIDAANVRVTATYRLAASFSELPVRLSVDAGTKILDVDIDGVAIDWHALLIATPGSYTKGAADEAQATETNEPTSTPQTTLVDLGVTLRECAGKTITIRTIAPYSTNQPLTLAVVQLDGTYCVSGESRVATKRGILLSQVLLDGKQLPAKLQDSSQQRSVAWMGQPPALTAEVAYRAQVWEVDSLTRFSIQPAWLSATCRARVNIAQAKTNLLTFRIDRNWFVDSVRILGDAASRLRTNLRQAKETQRWFVDVTWDDNPVDLQFDIEIAAHDPRNRRAEQLNLRPRSLLTLAGAQHNDYFVIEPSGQYRLDVTRSLLSHQVQPVDLPAWQRDELADAGEAWSFAQHQGSVPSVKLSAYRGSIVANIVSVAQQSGREKATDDVEGAGSTNAPQGPAALGWKVISNIECRPISGAVTSVSCVLPASVQPEDVEWLLLRSDSELDSSSLTIGPVARSSEDARLVAIELPAPTSQPFTLQARIAASVAGVEVELPVVAVPGAIGGSSTILLPPELSLSFSSSGVQVLPDVKGFNDTRYDDLLAGRTAKQRSEFVAARVDAAASHLLPASIVETTKNDSVWIQEQSIEHRALAGPELQHIVKWTVKAGTDAALIVNLPDQWQLRSLRIDSEPLDTAVVERQRLTIDLPANSTVEVEGTFASASAGGGWMQRLDLQQPSVEAPVVSMRRFVNIPPSMTTYGLWTLSGRGETLMDRIVPRQLWRILAPRGPDESVATWTTIELPPVEHSAEVADSQLPAPAAGTDLVVLSRTALAAFSTALVLMLIGLLRYFVSHSLAYWFSIFLAVMASVLLVPVGMLPIAQLMLLSVCCALTLRLMYPVFRYRNSSEVATNGSRSRSMRSVAGVLLVALLQASAARGQLFEQGSVEQAGKKTYGLLIPTVETEEGLDVAGSYAYIPKELLELLRRGDEGGQTDSQPHILAADYHLRLRRNTLNGVTRATDFRLDLDAAFPLVASELVLPFADPQIVLTGALISGQSVAPGGRVVQENGTIVIRPATVGEIDIQLQFAELTPIHSQGKSTLQVAVPPLPVSTLRIVTDGQQDFEIESIGPVQRSMASTLARIGQLDRLHVSWIDNGLIVDAAPQPLQLKSQTWLHAASGKLVAASRFSLSGAIPASGEFSVVVDAGWAPVGDQWGDAKVLDSSLVAYGRQVSYRLRCSPEREDQDRCDVRLLLVPRNLDRAVTLRAPFLTLQGSSQPERVFFWSADPQARWRPEDLAFWQPSDPADFAPWDTLAFGGVQPVAFTATPEAGAPAARRQVVSKTSDFVAREETQLHLGAAESRVDYTAQFDVPWEQGQFRLQIPDDCIVRGVQIDGVDVGTFSVGEQPSGRILIVDSPASSVTSLTVQVDQRTRLGVLTKMPRVTLSGVSVRSSRYYIFRGVGLDCQLESIPELSFAAFDVPASQLLQQLEAAVAAVDLEGNYRDVRQLPSAYRVRRKASQSKLQTLQKIVRTEQGWQETLYCVWSNVESALDIVCLEIPTRLRDEIDLGPLSRRYVPTGDPDTLTLCVLPPPPENSSVMIAMRFPVATATSNQTLGLEKIKVLDDDEVVSYIALPSEFRIPGSAQPLPVRWTKVGREVSASGFGNMLGQGPWKVYRTLGRQTQASWLARGTAKSGRLLRQQMEFTSLDSSGLTALASYWIDPAGQTNFSAAIPDGCELLGIRSGGRILDWHFENADDSGKQDSGGRAARVLLQPNYLPTHLSLLLRYRAPASSLMNVPLPEVRMEGSGQQVDVVNNLSGYTVGNAVTRSVERSDDSAVPGGEPMATEVQQWASILADALPTLSGLAEDEVTQWLQSWHPSHFGISPDAVVQLPDALRNDEASVSEALAAEYWRAIGEELGSSLSDNLREAEIAQRGRVMPQQTKLASGGVLTLRKIVVQTNRYSRLGAATALLLILALVLVLRQRIGASYKLFLAHNPWLYWLQLAAVLVVVLPVIWPAAIICLLATISATSQWLDHWKRRRAGIQPR